MAFFSPITFLFQLISTDLRSYQFACPIAKASSCAFAGKNARTQRKGRLGELVVVSRFQLTVAGGGRSLRISCNQPLVHHRTRGQKSAYLCSLGHRAAIPKLVPNHLNSASAAARGWDAPAKVPRRDTPIGFKAFLEALLPLWCLRQGVQSFPLRNIILFILRSGWADEAAQHECR